MTTIEGDAQAPALEAVYVYGIVPASATLPDLDEGLGVGAGLELVSDGPVAAVVEMIDADRPLGRRRDLLSHSTVLNAMAEQGGVLPLRFGSVVASREAVLEELLAPQRDRFARMLEDVAGYVQYNLRATYVLDTVLAEVVSAEPEVAALRARTAGLPEDAGHADRVRLGELVARAVDARRRGDTDGILDALEPRAEAVSVSEVSGMDSLAEIAFCVARTGEAAFVEAAEVLAESLDGRARLSLVGPMALYDFGPEE